MKDQHDSAPSSTEQAQAPTNAAPEAQTPFLLAGAGAQLGGAVLQRKIQRRLQRRASQSAGGQDSAALQAAADRGTSGTPASLPHREQIQASFGRHDVSAVPAFVGGPAQQAADSIGAEAYATNDKVAFAQAPDLHTAAHEAAHVVQQRGGVQLHGGVGEAGDPYERHADAVANAVVAGRSAEHLLDGGANGGAATGHALQRKEMPEDTGVLANQATLKNTDVEIPALEGALLSGRLAAVHKGLLSQASFDAGLALSQRMTLLQPAVKANRPVDAGAQAAAAGAARQLYAALVQETTGDKNFHVEPDYSGAGGAVSSANPYTGESKVTTSFLFWSQTNHFDGWVKQLPEFLQAGKWSDAFEAYKRLTDGLDQWVADQLRSAGKGTTEEAQGNAQAHFRQLRNGLEQIADKHAARLPALFHPDAATVQKDKEAGRPAIESVPMNVYFWKDASDGKYRLYDLTTPGRPHEQPIDGEPTAAAMTTFFEEVARYPLGEVRYQIPNGTAGVAPTTGKTKWYEWLGYAGLAVAGVGLALLTGGASVPATVCFAAGALAGGISAAGHLVDSASLGTATTASVVLDVAQVVSSVASFGALSITMKAGGAAAAIAGSRVFVPLTVTAAGSDVVQLAAFSDVAYHELETVRKSGGSDEDVQRAGAVLLTQLAVMGGLTVLSVRGARDVSVLKGKPLELVTGEKGLTLQIEGEGAATATNEQRVHANGKTEPSAHSETASHAETAAHVETPPPAIAHADAKSAVKRYANLTAADFSGAADPKLIEIAKAANLENSDVAQRLRSAIESAGVKDVEIQFRAKSVASIYGKLQETPGATVKDIKDLSGIRVNIKNITEGNFKQYDQIKEVIQHEFEIADTAVKDYNKKPNPWGYTGRIHMFEIGGAGIYSEIQVGSKDLSGFIEKKFTLPGGKTIELHDLTGYKGQLYGKAVPPELQQEYTALIGKITDVNKSGRNLAQDPATSAEVEKFFQKVHAFLGTGQ